MRNISMILFSWASKLYSSMLQHPNYKADISMPVMNGIDSTRAIRKVESERGQRPATIIALTGLGSSSIRQEAFSSGINNFLTKPVGFNQLREILNNWTPDMDA